MRITTTLRILGLLLMLFSFTMLPPIAVSILFSDAQTPLFLNAFILIFGIGTVRVGFHFGIKNENFGSEMAF